jgi:hypothetical protein
LATSVSIREKRVTLIDNFFPGSWHLFTYSIYRDFYLVQQSNQRCSPTCMYRRCSVCLFVSTCGSRAIW